MNDTFKITYFDAESGQLETNSVSGDTIKTKPFGIFILNYGKKVERFFSKLIWREVELGNYETSKHINPQYKVTVDDKQYTVSSVEFDNEGVLTLSIWSEEIKNNTKIKVNHWLLMKASGTVMYVQSFKI